MSKISMDEKLTDLKKVIFKLSEIGCLLSAENEKQSELLKSTESEITYLKGQVKKLEEDNEFTINYNTELKEEKTALSKDVESLEYENQEMADEIDLLEKENKSLNERISQLKNDNDKLTRKLYEYEDAKKSKKSELQSKLNLAEEQIRELNTENYSLKRQLANQEQMKKDLNRLMNQIEDIQKSVKGLNDNGENVSENSDEFTPATFIEEQITSVGDTGEYEQEKQPNENNSPDNPSETPKTPCSDAENSDNSDCGGNDTAVIDSNIRETNEGNEALPNQDGGY